MIASHSEAIILHARTIREDDLLVDFLTEDRGRLWGVARHGRKSRKRFGTILESANIVRLRFQDRGGMVSLDEATLSEPLTHLDEDLSRLLCVFYVIDLVREFFPERNPEQLIYSLLKKTLIRLNRGEPFREVICSFQRDFLDVSGYGLSLDRCRVCGRSPEEKIPFYFVYSEGGIFCRDCVSHPSRDLFHPEALHHILPRFIEYQLGHPPRSRKLLTRSGNLYPTSFSFETNR